ncbi:MAG: GNAT family N-acetyltransferase [Anaerolineae bacterium]|nr:GNAT family N-acetyltransferase [Anaerolineae bacterium]
MLEGILVDLVPRGADFAAHEHAWRINESNTWRSGGFRRVESRAQAERQRTNQREAMRNDPSIGVEFGIRTKPTDAAPGVPIGYIRTRRVHPAHHWGMLTIQIGNADYWGGGYGTDAALLFIEYCFTWLDLRRVWLITTDKNARVLRQMEKLGFALEGRRRRGALIDGVWHDWLFFGLLREEWAGREALVDALGLTSPPKSPSPAKPERGT